MYASTRSDCAGDERMAADPNEPGQTQPPDKAGAPTLWPESAGMAAQQSAANEMFRKNSERLQEAGENKSQSASNEEPEIDSQDLPPAEDHAQGHYNDLKLEHADATGRESDDGQTNERETGERELTFVKDAGRGNHASLKQEQSAADTPEQEQETGERKLTFVKDGERGNAAEQKEEPTTPGKSLSFVKDHEPDLSRGP